MAEEKLKEYTPEEVFAHTSEDDCWLVIGKRKQWYVWQHFSLRHISAFLAAPATEVAATRKMREGLQIVVFVTTHHFIFIVTIILQVVPRSTM